MPCEPGNIDTTTPTGLTENSTEFVRLRRATPADAIAMGLIGSAAFLEAFTWLLPGQDILDFCTRSHNAEFYAKYLALPDTNITLAETATGAPIGYAMLTAPDIPSIEVHAGDIELKRLYLFSRFRSLKTPVLDETGQVVAGLRTGQALMDAAVAEARAMGRTRLLLGTHAGNQRAIGFYHRNGFTEVGTRSFHVGSQICCDYILAKTL
ncbi:MAG TPA: N-acetyltransferase [Acidobacteriaceae bacterium]|jgi:ribosomal protein S18 acetylase RimI-like enzyme